MREMGSELAAAVDLLFAALTVEDALPEVLSGCPLCFTEADEEALRSPPRQVAPRDLASFVGHPSDHFQQYPLLLRRLFPAVAAALAADELHVDAGLVLSRLNEAEWRTWSSPERTAVERYLDALFLDVLLTPPPAPGGLFAEEVLSGVATATGSVRRWLELWDAHGFARTARHLESVVGINADELLAPDEPPLVGWWPDDSVRELRDWLRRDAVIGALRQLQALQPSERLGRIVKTVELLRAR